MALLTSPTVRAASELARISVRTGWRYLRDPAVKRELTQVLDDELARATARVVGEMVSSLGTLAAIHKDGDAPAGARVSAARSVLHSGPRLWEVLELSERVAELERRFGRWDRERFQWEARDDSDDIG